LGYLFKNGSLGNLCLRIGSPQLIEFSMTLSF